MSRFFWTDEITAEATELWREGVSAACIAERMGVSRSAVAGKMNRMGVASPNGKRRRRTRWTDEMTVTLKRMWSEDISVAAIAKALDCSETAVYTKQRALGLSSRGLQGRNRRNRKTSGSSPSRPDGKFPEPQHTPAPDVGDEPESLDLELVDLTTTTCRWPHGEVSRQGFGFCGHTVRAGTPYCDYHARVAYPRLREREAVI